MTSAPTREQRVRGVVRWYNRVSGFGFIRVEGQRDVFVGETAIRDSKPRALNEGQSVELSIVERHGRREADDVAPLTVV